MKLVVPHLGTPHPTDARLMRLAEFLGIACQTLFLERRERDHAEHLAEELPKEGQCLVVNPQVIKQWTGGPFSQDLASSMARFPFLFVHALSSDPFCESLIKVLSCDRLQSVRGAADSGQLYEIAPDDRGVCGPFSGISFGPVNPANDYALTVSADHGALQRPISIGGNAFMAITRRDKAEIFFVASADTSDVNETIWDVPLSQYFSRFVPHVMAFRRIFGELCWHPTQPCASFILDDPLLRPRYGYLEYGSLLNLMKRYNFSTTIAFIPHNYRRSSKRIVQMFRQSSGRLAICFHGNDHTAGELASTDTSRLNAMLRIAEARMDAQASATGLACPKVMVFPQDMFSVEAMKVLKSRNFYAAATGSAHPAGRRAHLTLRELAQPAILRHGEFPLFFRKFVGRLKKEDVAFSLFFGQPVLVTEHHGVFKQTESLIEDVTTINAMGPHIRWCDLGTAVLNSTLSRSTPDGTHHVRAYSSVVRIVNDWDSPRWFRVEWSHSLDCPPIDRLLRGDVPVHSFEVDDSTIQLSVKMDPRSSETVGVAFRNEYPSLQGLGFVWSAKAFLRRRLSEARDNYLSKSRFATSVAQTLQRRLLSKGF